MRVGLPSGRLFWKFFFAFWLALVVAGFCVGLAVWLHRQTLAENDGGLAGGPRAAFVLEAASATLEHGGSTALRQLLSTPRARREPRILAVDAGGRELLGRGVTAEVLKRAQQAADGTTDAVHARRVTSRDGVQWLLFVSAEDSLADEGRRLLREFSGEFGPRPERMPPPPGEGPSRGDFRFDPGGPPPDRPPPQGMPPKGSPPSPIMPIVTGLLASLGFSALAAWYLAKPIRNLRWAFDAAAQGKLDTRVQPLMGNRRDEIADLGRDFDSMAQRLQALVSSQQRLLHDVSHELRSPLARMQAAIGLARQNPHKTEMALDRVERESTRLDKLVGEILALSRLEAKAGKQSGEDIDIAGLVAEIVEDARFEAEASGKRVDFTGPAIAVSVHGQTELLYRAVENVVRNAVKYAYEGAGIDVVVSADRTSRQVRIKVSDRGPGVPEGDLAAIFDPFFRGSNGESAAGFGLGLAIAKRAIELHDGTISARNREGGGLSVEITLACV